MKILQVAERTFPAKGGVELHTAMISKKLVEKGHEVTLAVFNSLDQHDCGFGLTYQNPFLVIKSRKPSLPEAELWNGVQILRFPSRAQLFSYYWSPGMLKWLINNIRRFDVVHTHCFRFSNNEFVIIAHLLNNHSVPIVFTCHDAAMLDYMGLGARLLDEVYRRTIGKKLIKLASRLIALTESNAYEYTKYLFVNPKKISVVANGIDFERYQNLPNPSDLKEKLDNPEYVILFIGRFIGYKNPDKLILAFRKIAHKYPKSHLLMIGKDYGMLDYCKKIACERVTFFENASEKMKLKALALATICVIPSEYEGFGIVGLEAQAAGVPIVASNAGGLKHILIHGVTGLHIKSPTPEEISNAILFLLENPELRKKMGEMGRQFSKRFSWERVVEKLENIYADVLNHERKQNLMYHD